jgi:Uma2 family endonuclease
MEAVVLKDSITGSMSDHEFFRFCLENKDLRIERNSNLEIIIMSPVTTKYSFYSGAVYVQLYNWNAREKTGIAFDSSAGFTLSDRSVLSPDASWVSREVWNSLSDDDQNRFAPICPEFVVEVRSKTDAIEDLKSKMRVWMSNGAKLSWLIDPIEKNTHISSATGMEKVISGFDNQKIKGEGPVEGFELNLNELKI